MIRQLDILALEPFFGGVRRNMLETLVRSSRHRWTLLTLPPRRMERRLAASAHWFAEQIARTHIGHFDVLFTCDALNLADLFRLCPAVAGHPSVVYFHSNQLPDPANFNPDGNLDLTNLTTATTAGEIWFNSQYHARSFMDGIEELVATHEELQSRNPIEDLHTKRHLMPPPVDLSWAREVAGSQSLERDPNAVFVETAEANVELLNAALIRLHQEKHPINLVVTGPVNQLTDCFPRRVIHETDVAGQIRGLLTCGTFVSTRIAPTFDENAVRAMSLGCRPVLPHTGVYPEIVPHHLQPDCLYDMSAESLTAHIHEAMYLVPMYHIDELVTRLKPFDVLTACDKIDNRLEHLAGAKPADPHRSQKPDHRDPHPRAVPHG